MERSIERLLEKSHQASSFQKSHKPTSCLHVVCTVPISSREVSTDLKNRDRVHWSLVRVIVCTLWRSRLVSSDSGVSHLNSLCLVFDDGVTIYLSENEFVARLANQHQAPHASFKF